ncbi:MAG TPA: 3-deoxy-7-phosphoheptulonate synthase [Sporomusa sphaeroides]|nr:3-deoxy-7-phosphoheptulonate synthase [Sporomusa sphaeroides]HML33614.1 3-deoxy-7-phosphoheptulonate synthase [Sporomusa sphaeroides]
MAKNLMEVGLQYPLFQEEAAPVNSVNDQKKSVVGGIAVDGFPGVKKSNSCKLVSREFRQEDTVVDVQGVKIGGKHLGIMAGPCAVESQEQLLEAAKAVKRIGAQFLRGGAYKPRSSPYSFQGLEEKGLQMLAKAREQTGLKVVTEVMDAAAVGMISQYADVLQIGTRNMQNSNLLRAVGKTDKPVLLKRGMAATISEWLDAAEYIMCEGNHNVILCERGIRTFETYTRNTLDLGAVVAVKRLSHLPVIVDPSHGTGRWKMVRPMACAAVAAGADGLIIEVHPNPDVALCDGKQSLTPENFSLLMTEVGSIAAISGKSILYREK